MTRYKCKISYDGTAFHGYQVQPNKRTVQSELEAALKKLHKGREVKVTSSGRTDAGVHAKGQVIHFDSNLNIPLSKWQLALHAALPSEIAILAVEEVDQGFHARFDAGGKEYRYFIDSRKIRDPFQRNYSYHFPFPLDLDSMKEACVHFIGEYDFTSFCSAKTEVMDRVRTIYDLDISSEGEQLVLRFRGNGFLYNMVRIIVGTLIQVGNGDITPDSIPGIIEKRDRTFAGKTAPPQGLYLWEVFYE
ncbi:tRNA pseudouridine(38-40) synthase TruA [Robertmurraya sp. P23]|uniref:tRNA pseudouridine(38-40) synthase TruA n=1 Tax=Robertmurraya sp. P23 TaxID=3436931 RepID=UPI003D958A24